MTNVMGKDPSLRFLAPATYMKPSGRARLPDSAAAAADGDDDDDEEEEEEEEDDDDREDRRRRPGGRRRRRQVSVSPDQPSSWSHRIPSSHLQLYCIRPVR